MKLPDFKLKSDQYLSKICRQNGIQSFQKALDFVYKLPYGRNSSKKDLSQVFLERRGTCSTKHAALRQLAIENGISDIKLMLGIYRMNELNTPGVGKVLKKYKLLYIPEAHNYLSFDNHRIDITRKMETKESPFDTIIHEIEISPYQIIDFKTNFHKSFLEQWLRRSRQDFSLQSIWEIREECIAALSNY